MQKVLLLGGTQHLQTVPVDPGFGSPISHCNGKDEPERYHRTVFYPSNAGANVAKVWYVYVSDAYQSQSEQLSEDTLIAKLKECKIPPHIESIGATQLQDERRLNIA